MLAEKIIFNILAFSLFIIIFSKMIKKNDTSYIYILLLQALGICIDFIEIRFSLKQVPVLLLVRYIVSILLPIIIILAEKNQINLIEFSSLGLGIFALTIGNNKFAKKIFIDLVTKVPESYLGHKLLAQIYEKEGGMRKAIDEYVCAIDIKKNDYESYFTVTKLLKDLGKKEEAIEMLQTLLRNKPDYYEASIQLGDLLMEQERLKEAVTVYNEALKYNPSEYELYYNLGIAYTRLSDFQMAKEMYEKAASINHYLYLGHYSLGMICLFENDLESAREHFKKSIYDELEPKAYYQLAKIYILKNEKDMAINFLNKAIELDNKLMKKAEKEPAFESIKQYITVSVKMDEDETEIEKEETLTEKEKKALQFLEETILTGEIINSNTNKQKITERVSEIFDKEKLKKIEQQEEMEEINQEFLLEKNNQE